MGDFAFLTGHLTTPYIWGVGSNPENRFFPRAFERRFFSEMRWGMHLRCIVNIYGSCIFKSSHLLSVSLSLSLSLHVLFFLKAGIVPTGNLFAQNKIRTSKADVKMQTKVLQYIVWSTKWRPNIKDWCKIGMLKRPTQPVARNAGRTSKSEVKGF